MRRLVFFFGILVIMSFGLHAAQSSWLFNSKDVTALHSKPPTVRLSYGDNVENYGLLRMPEGKGPFPVAIVVHGGCWLSSMANVTNTEAFADALRDAGFATWNIEYRRVDEPGGGFPGTFLDVAHAADFLRQIAPTYNLDLDRVVALGHSSGGHLALWLAARSKLSNQSPLYLSTPLKLQAVISMAGVPDLKQAFQQADKVCGREVMARLLGTTDPEKLDARFAEISPLAMLPFHVKQVVVVGGKDAVVPEFVGEQYAAAAKKAGDSVLLLNIPGSGHHEYIVPNSIVWPKLVLAIKGMMGGV